MKTIVALVDFSEVTSKILDHAKKFAKAFSAKVVILHVVPKEAVVVDFGLVSPTVLQSPDNDAVKADYATLLKLQESFTQSGIDAEVHQLREGSAENILQETNRLEADLMILAATHHSAVYSWFIGTISDDILKSASCPVLVVPFVGRGAS